MPATIRLRDLLILALSAGILTGFGEAAALAIRKLVAGRVMRVPLDVVWMAPLADSLLMLGAGLPLCAVLVARPRGIPLRLVLVAYGLVAGLSFRFLAESIDERAWWLLSFGVAVALARQAASWGLDVPRLARRGLPWLAALVLLLAVSVAGWRWQATRLAEARLPPAAPGRPNVLFIVLDTVRASSLSLHGYQHNTTPRLEQLARRGVRFDFAVATAPWTLTSHAGMFTGRLPHELTADWQVPLDAVHPTLAESLRDQGYQTAGVVANMWYCVSEFGLARGFDHWEDYRVTLGRTLECSYLARSIDRLWESWPEKRPGRFDPKTAEDVNRSALRWLSGRDPNRPFFLFLNYMDAHEPYQPPPPYDTKFSARPLANPWLDARRRHTDGEAAAFRDAYDGCLAYLDEQLGRLFDELDRRRLLDETLVVVTSDHGEQFGEHGLLGHGNSCYLPVLHVPLVIWHPQRVPAGRAVHERISLADLPATVTDLVGIKPPAPFPGESLARCWQEPDRSAGAVSAPLVSGIRRRRNSAPWWPTARGDVESVIWGDYHYIHNGDGSEELYDLQADPLEQRNLAGLSRCGELVARARAFRSSTK